MARALAVPLTLLLALGFLLLLFALGSVTGLPLCSEPGGTGGEDCIESTGSERALGLALGAAAVLCAGAGAWLGLRCARRGTHGGMLAIAAIATLLFALAALLLLPVSF